MTDDIRHPVVAGAFYAGKREALRQHLSTLLDRSCPAPASPLRAPVTLIAPHAGYPYSGPTAGKGYAAVASMGKPHRVILLGANHTGLGPPVCVDNHALWRTPLGDVPVDRVTVNRLASSGIPVDRAPFIQEHSLEVQLPFMQALWPSELTIVPLLIQFAPLTLLSEAAKILRTITGPDDATLIVVSSDFTHYEADAAARRTDHLALDHILALNAAGFHDLCRTAGFSICGAGAITISMFIADSLRLDRSRVVDYATSGDVTGDRSAVVGYASVLFSRGEHD